jgi:SAM-dependent methyltransferase
MIFLHRIAHLSIWLVILVETTVAWVSSKTISRPRALTWPLSMASDDATKIITCLSTKELAQAVDEYIKPHHIVAELGSQLRDVSTRICHRCQRATLVDVHRKFPKAQQDTRRTDAMRLENTGDFFPEVAEFVEIAQLSDWNQAFFGKTQQQYDILVLDVNAIVGNDLEWTALNLIDQFQAWNGGCAVTVLVKSVGLNQWACRLVHAQRWRGMEDYKAIPPPHIIGTRGVHEYRSTIPYTVRPTDAVLEVGCHFGTTTTLLQDQGQYCIGVDVGSKIIKEADKRHSGICFRVGDAWKTAALLRLQQEYYQESQTSGRIGFDVVYVDVGGLSGSDGLLEAIHLISSIRYALEPRCIVIKSLCIQRLSSRLVPFYRPQQRKQEEVTG